MNNKNTMKKNLRMLLGYTVLFIAFCFVVYYGIDYIYTHQLTQDIAKIAIFSLAIVAFLTIIILINKFRL